MSFAAGFASTFFPAIEEEIEGRKERAEKNADLAWTMFTENMTKRQEARAEAERLRRQAETLVEANGGSRDMIPDVYNLLRDEGVGFPARNGHHDGGVFRRAAGDRLWQASGWFYTA